MSDGDISEEMRQRVLQNGHDAAGEWLRQELKNAPVVEKRMKPDDLGPSRPRLDLRASPDDKAVELLSKLESGMYSAPAFRDLKIEPRAKLIGDWFREGDLGILFAPRGLGKTFLALLMGQGISEKAPVGPWRVQADPVGVLFIDGEMPAELMQERVKSMEINSPLFTILNHEELFKKTDIVLNLTEKTTQTAITEICVKHKKKVLVLDNLSCLFQGVKENDADDWEKVLPWLLHLRRLGIAVIIVAHSGRNNATIRGTSRREDAAFWIIRLDEVNVSGPRTGSRFISRFQKQRNSPEDPGAYEWWFEPDGDKTRITYKPASSEDVMLQLIKEGVGSASEIAEEMHVSKGQVSKMAKKLKDRGVITMEKRGYALTHQSEEEDGE
jgi:biotin operon repressor